MSDNNEVMGMAHKNFIWNFNPELDLQEGTSISDKLFLYLKRLIVSKTLPVGYKFPNEPMFCKILNVSRSTLREAYSILELSNLIVRSKGGTKVIDPDEIASFNHLFKNIKQSDMHDIMECRSLIEAQIAFLAAQRATDEDISNLQIYLDNMIKHKNDLTLFSYYDSLFHSVIYNASKNYMLKQTMKAVRNAYSQTIYSAFVQNPEVQEHAIQYHTLLLQAISEHAPIRAQEVMREHICDASGSL